MTSTWLVLVLAGCRSPEPLESGCPTGPCDTGAPEASGVALTGVPAEDAPVTGPIRAGLVRVRFGGGPAVGETLLSAILAPGESATLSLPVDGPGLASDPLAPGAAPGDVGVEGTLLLPLAWEDVDADGAFDEGEVIRGASLARWVAWLQAGEAPVEVPGWSGVDLGIAGAYEPGRCMLDTTWPLAWRDGWPAWSDLDPGIALPLPGFPASLTLGGVVGALPAGITGLVGLPYPAFTAGGVQSAFDVPLDGATFSASATQAPPASDDTGTDPDWRTTMHLPLAYADTGGDGAWSDGDPLDAVTTCLDGNPVWARYTREVTSYRGYRFLDCYAGTVGWRAVTGDAETGQVRYLPTADANRLQVDTGCRVGK